MSYLGHTRLCWVAVLALGISSVGGARYEAAARDDDRAGIAEPDGELWIAASPAACSEREDRLSEYESEIRARASAAMSRLSRVPRMITSRADLRAAVRDLQRRRTCGWLLVFFSGHGAILDGRSHVCLGTDSGLGEWLDIEGEFLPALPASLGGAVIILDACSSAQVDARRASIPVTIISASPDRVDTNALFGATVLDSMVDGRDENCNGVFDDDDLFIGLTHRLRAALSLVAFNAWPKLRRNAPSPLPLPLPARNLERCAESVTVAAAMRSAVLPRALIEQRTVQRAIARGNTLLPRLDHDFFVIAAGADPDVADRLRVLATSAGLEEIRGLDAGQASTLASRITFTEIYQLEPSLGWLRTWRLRDRTLLSVFRLSMAACGIPSRVLPSHPDRINPYLPPRYSRAVRYLRGVHGDPPGPATVCFEAEGQCFIEPSTRETGEECRP